MSCSLDNKPDALSEGPTTSSLDETGRCIGITTGKPRTLLHECMTSFPWDYVTGVIIVYALFVDGKNARHDRLYHLVLCTTNVEPTGLDPHSRSGSYTVRIQAVYSPVRGRISPETDSGTNQPIYNKASDFRGHYAIGRYFRRISKKPMPNCLILVTTSIVKRAGQSST